MNESHGDASVCVITGDLADQGERAAYAALRDCLEDLRPECRLLLGNHDDRSAFRDVFADAPLDPNGFVQSRLDVDGWSLIFLDTLDDAHPGRGLLCDRRLGWLEDALKDHRHKPTVVFMHHPPASIGVPCFEDMLLANGAVFLELLDAFPNVRHIAFGHVHMTLSGRWQRASYSASRGTCHKIAPSLVSDHVTYVDAGPSFDVLLLGDDGTVIIHTIDPAGPNVLVARAYPTEDGVGRIEMTADRSTTVWV